MGKHLGESTEGKVSMSLLGHSSGLLAELQEVGEIGKDLGLIRTSRALAVDF